MVFILVKGKLKKNLKITKLLSYRQVPLVYFVSVNFSGVLYERKE